MFTFWTQWVPSGTDGQDMAQYCGFKRTCINRSNSTCLAYHKVCLTLTQAHFGPLHNLVKREELEAPRWPNP